MTTEGWLLSNGLYLPDQRGPNLALRNFWRYAEDEYLREWAREWRSHMGPFLNSDWPFSFEPGDLGSGVISSYSATSLGGTAGNVAAVVGSAWPAANRAIFVPCRIPRNVTVYQMAVGAGTTAAGNFDLGIYDANGVRLVSTGATAKGASTEHIINVTDTVIESGLKFLAQAADGTNNYISWSLTSMTASLLKFLGIREMATAYTLPNPATFATNTGTLIPAIGAYLRSYA